MQACIHPPGDPELQGDEAPHCLRVCVCVCSFTPCCQLHTYDSCAAKIYLSCMCERMQFGFYLFFSARFFPLALVSFRLAVVCSAEHVPPHGIENGEHFVVDDDVEGDVCVCVLLLAYECVSSISQLFQRREPSASTAKLRYVSVTPHSAHTHRRTIAPEMGYLRTASLCES